MSLENDGKDRVINFSVKKTEENWGRTIQGLYENFTPLWFKWMGWLFAVGGFSYLSDKTGSKALSIIASVSYILLFFYFSHFIGSFKIEPYHSWAMGQKTILRRFLALLPVLLISIAIILTINVFINHVIEEIKLTK